MTDQDIHKRLVDVYRSVLSTDTDVLIPLLGMLYRAAKAHYDTSHTVTLTLQGIVAGNATTVRLGLLKVVVSQQIHRKLSYKMLSDLVSDIRYCFETIQCAIRTVRVTEIEEKLRLIRLAAEFEFYKDFLQNELRLRGDEVYDDTVPDYQHG